MYPWLCPWRIYPWLCPFIEFQMCAEPIVCPNLQKLSVFKLSADSVTPWPVFSLALSSFRYLIFAEPSLLIIASALVSGHVGGHNPQSWLWSDLCLQNSLWPPGPQQETGLLPGDQRSLGAQGREGGPGLRVGLVGLALGWVLPEQHYRKWKEGLWWAV